MDGFLKRYWMPGIQPEWLKAYYVSLMRHIAYVTQAGVRLGVPMEQLAQHDQSKFSIEEFPQYARNFYGDKGDPDGYLVAWLHHQNHNAHHWQYWITRGDNDKYEALPMPEVYVREMVADWVGAAMAYNGSWDISEWTEEKLKSMKLHPRTTERLMPILEEIRYGKAMEQ